jgi:hypothetical protein
LQHLLEELADGALALGGMGEFGAWGEDTEGGIGGDLVDEFFGFGFGHALRGWFFGEVEAGDLEAVE